MLPHTPKDYILKVSREEIIHKGELVRRLTKKDFQLVPDLYQNVDYSVPMRGHGQMIPFSLNVPFVSLSTQDKVKGFAFYSGLEDYSVDIKEEDWAQKLDDKVGKLNTDEQYLSEWYTIRNRKMAECQEQNDKFVEKMLE